MTNDRRRRTKEMKKIDGYWIDENGNRWNDCSKERAKELSSSMINCYNCDNCWDCRNCHYCHDCWDCRNCHYCDNCYNCDNCHNCHNCNNCDNCRDCWNCDNCDNCHNCRDCEDCRGCQDCEDCRGCRDCDNCHNCLDCEDCRGCQKYTDNPMLYRTAEIGSRKAQTLFYFGKIANGTSLQIVCGCFRGNLEKFEKAVLKTHENNEVYRKQYLEEIQKVKVLFGMQNDK